MIKMGHLTDESTCVQKVNAVYTELKLLLSGSLGLAGHYL